jgi:hypothetical protein
MGTDPKNNKFAFEVLFPHYEHRMGTGKGLCSLCPFLCSFLCSRHEVLLNMAKTTRISKLESKNLAEALGHAKRSRKVTEYVSPVVVARLLLEAFVYEDGNINSEWFVREKACPLGKFTKLRDRLIADQWIHFREDSRRYFAGVRLQPHIEILKETKTATLAQLEAFSLQKADKSDLHDLDLKKADKAELELRLAETNSRIDAIAVAVRELQDAMIPPDTPEKKNTREKSARTISALAH